MGGVARRILPKPPAPPPAPVYTPPPAPVATVAPTTAEVSQATSTMMSDASTVVSNNKKGRKSTILQKAKGLGDTNLNTTKKTLGE
tara:strand:- start:1288 stop:1545 length:258 start_codon:yes stop_codon:yes gene_type:complete